MSTNLYWLSIRKNEHPNKQKSDKGYVCYHTRVYTPNKASTAERHGGLYKSGDLAYNAAMPHSRMPYIRRDLTLDLVRDTVPQ